jgi:coproporphyrinogen III oxidase
MSEKIEFKITNLISVRDYGGVFFDERERIDVMADVDDGKTLFTITIRVKKKDLTNDRKMKRAFLKAYHKRLKDRAKAAKEYAEDKKTLALMQSMVGKVIDP